MECTDAFCLGQTVILAAVHDQLRRAPLVYEVDRVEPIDEEVVTHNSPRKLEFALFEGLFSLGVPGAAAPLVVELYERSVGYIPVACERILTKNSSSVEYPL